jgi:sugar-specific transcriptional regulator TrmB
MTDSQSDGEPRTVAVEQLTSFGLSTYAARTFVALAVLGDGTAQDVSDVADVPRTRVYDAAEELREWQLVDVQQSTPKRFWAVSVDTAARQFDRAYRRRLDRLTASLRSFTPEDRTEEQRGVWTVTGRTAVHDRVIEFVDSAEEEVVYTTAADLLTEEVVDALSAASERGVTIRLAGMSSAATAAVREELPDATTFESMWNWDDTPAGRLLMVDRERTLVSVLLPGNGDHPPNPLDETAIWGTGSTNGLVIVLRALFTWQLDGDRE